MSADHLLGRVHVGDCVETMRSWPAGIANTCVTSPPYFGLRDYKNPPRVWGGDPDCRHEDWGPGIHLHKGGNRGTRSTLLDMGRGTRAAQVDIKRTHAGNFCACAWKDYKPQ